MRRFYIFLLSTLLLAALCQNGAAQLATLPSESAERQARAERWQRLIAEKAAAMEQKVIAWRRDLHQNPELSNREFRTAKVVADHLKSLGLEVQTGVAHTGVVAVLRGALPGKVVALRADMDALPVAEETGLPFASKVKTTYNGQEVGVMHACGHDCHTAILMGVAEILAGMKKELRGTVKFIFQPAEEGAPAGEEGGADLMIKQGVLENPKPDAIFGLHVFAGLESGKIAYRPGPTMAAVDNLEITIKGRQTHGAKPWAGVDPIVVSSQVILGLQTIVSRQVDVTAEPSIITIGSIRGGIRQNIIPDSVHLLGTIRTFNEEMQNDIHARIQNTSELIAKSAGAQARVTIKKLYPATHNDEALTAQMAPSLARAVGKDNVMTIGKITGSEDFSFYQKKIPGFFFFVGVTPKSDLKTAAANHSPRFFVDESALQSGLKAMLQVALDFLESR